MIWQPSDFGVSSAYQLLTLISASTTALNGRRHLSVWRFTFAVERKKKQSIQSIIEARVSRTLLPFAMHIRFEWRDP